MTAELHLHGKPIASVFELLGSKENDITFSVGWALARCPHLCERFIKHILPGATNTVVDIVSLQERGDGGITDIELKGPDVHVIIEAKRGFEVPGPDQIQRYTQRLHNQPRQCKAIVTLSEASVAFASTRLAKAVADIPCIHISLKDVYKLTQQRGGSHAEKRLVSELGTYLNRIARMQDLTSNMVYVVALSDGRPAQCEFTWREMVEKHHRYIHPVGGVYPREPVNYLGFRFAGQLQYIRHADACDVVESLDGIMRGCNYPLECPHYIYTLGPAIIPSKTVRSGKTVMANRVYAAIDLLLTCDTISDAGELTRKRLNGG